MTPVSDNDIHNAASTYFEEWNEASGQTDLNGARLVASAIEVAGLRIASALQEVARELTQLPRG